MILFSSEDNVGFCLFVCLFVCFSPRCPGVLLLFLFLVFLFIVFLLLLPAVGYGTADAEIKLKSLLVGAPCCERFPHSNPGVGQKRASHAVSADRAHTDLVSAFSAQSTAFILSPLENFSDPQQ